MATKYNQKRERSDRFSDKRKRTNSAPAPSLEDRSFNNMIFDQFEEFIKSGETTLLMPPMNSYKRRLVHQLALEFEMESQSEGEDKERHNVLTKTDKTAVPQKSPLKQITWNHGNREYLTPKSRDGVKISLLSNGSVMTDGAYLPDDIITSKVVTTGSFKVINNRIIEFHEDGW